MRFKVLKSSLDGICGGGATYANIDEVLREIVYYKGWLSLDQLHQSIKMWSKQAKTGDIYTTHSAGIIAVGKGGKHV